MGKIGKLAAAAGAVALMFGIGSAKADSTQSFTFTTGGSAFNMTGGTLPSGDSISFVSSTSNTYFYDTQPGANLGKIYTDAGASTLATSLDTNSDISLHLATPLPALDTITGSFTLTFTPTPSAPGGPSSFTTVIPVSITQTGTGPFFDQVTGTSLPILGASSFLPAGSTVTLLDFGSSLDPLGSGAQIVITPGNGTNVPGTPLPNAGYATLGLLGVVAVANRRRFTKLV